MFEPAGNRAGGLMRGLIHVAEATTTAVNRRKNYAVPASASQSAYFTMRATDIAGVCI